MRNITTVSDFLMNWYPNIIKYQDTDCIFESNMTDAEKEYYKGMLNKLFGLYKWRGLPEDLDSISFEKINFLLWQDKINGKH